MCACLGSLRQRRFAGHFGSFSIVAWFSGFWQSVFSTNPKEPCQEENLRNTGFLQVRECQFRLNSVKLGLQKAKNVSILLLVIAMETIELSL